MTKGFRTAVASILLLLSLAACATAPGTGRSIFTGGLSQEGEKEMGAKEHPKILAEFGGAYDDPKLTAYVESIGNLLVQTSELPDLDFTFTVLDTPIINAFALPGGYVYVTRGLLALGRNEAEIAGVIGHEIGHVTARHSAERYGQNIAATIGVMAAGILVGRPGAQAASTIGGLALRSYSRDQEFESDMLGGRYLARAGYDTAGMAGFLSQLQEKSRLDAELAGQPGKADEFSIMQTHPRTADRIEAALAQSGEQSARGDPIVGREIYLEKLNGMLYGDNPEQGFVRGRAFAHPKLRFAFTVPEGFRLYNGSRQLSARHPDGAAIIFDRAQKDYDGPMTRYLQSVWAKDLRLSEVEALDIDGLAAATGSARVNTRDGRRDLRGLAIKYDTDTIYRFIFVTPPEQTAGLSEAFRRTTYSFRRLSEAEAADLKPLRLVLHRVASGETSAGLAERMPFDDFRLRRFLVLNGLAEGAPLQPGSIVKLVSE